MNEVKAYLKKLLADVCLENDLLMLQNKNIVDGAHVPVTDLECYENISIIGCAREDR